MTLNHIREIGDRLIKMEAKYKPATRAPKTEFMYDRLLYGILDGHYGTVQRQVPARYSGKKGRIDFQLGAPSNGTFLELAVGAKAAGNKTELHKLSKQRGGQRVLLLLNPTKAAIDIDDLAAAFRKIKPTRGKLPTRNDVRIVVAGPTKRAHPTSTIGDFSFKWLGTKSRDK